MKISALIPCYNAAPYLAEALDSVLSQSRAPDEVIVLDDGSTDDSAAVARGFSAKVRYVRQENQGIGAARNAALALAQGDWVTFLDADDLWAPGAIAARAAVVDSDPTFDFVFGLTEEFLNPAVGPASLVAGRAPPVAARVAGAALIRKQLFDKVGGFDTSLKLGETIDWIARMSEAGAKVAQIDRLVLRRRIHPTNTVRREVANQGDYLKVLKASLARRAARPGGEG